MYYTLFSYYIPLSGDSGGTPTAHKDTTPYKGLNKGKMYNTDIMKKKGK
jgi:hypothetical protein